MEHREQSQCRVGAHVGSGAAHEPTMQRETGLGHPQRVLMWSGLERSGAGCAFCNVLCAHRLLAALTGCPWVWGREESPCLALWGSSPSVSLMSTDTVNERDGGQPLQRATGVALSLDQSRALHRPGRVGHQDGEVQGAGSCLRLSTGTLSTLQAQQLHPLSQRYPTA